MKPIIILVIASLLNADEKDLFTEVKWRVFLKILFTKCQFPLRGRRIVELVSSRHDKASKISPCLLK